MRVEQAPSTGSDPVALDARAQVKRYLGALRRGWYVLAVLAVLGVALGWLSAPASGSDGAAKISYYRATHTLLRPSTQNGTLSTSQSTAPGVVSLSQASYLVGNSEIPARVAKKLGVTTEEVEKSLVGEPLVQVSSIEVRAIGTDPDLAVKVADLAAKELLTELDAKSKADYEAAFTAVVDKLDRLESQVAALNLQLAADPQNTELEAQRRSVTNQLAVTYQQRDDLASQPAPGAQLTSLTPAKAVEISRSDYDKARKEIRDGLPYETGVTPVGQTDDSSDDLDPGPGAGAPTRAVLGGLVGLMLGIGIVLALDRFDNRLRRREDVEAASGLDVLAEIPPLSRNSQHRLEVVAHTQHRSRTAEAYRVVRSALLFAVNNARLDNPAPEGDGIVVMVTSANPEEGKTTTVANLAAVLAEGGFSVLVLNCDFRRPRIHRYLLATEDADPAAATADATARPGAVAVADTAIERVKLITGVGEGDPDANPLEVVALQRKIVQMSRSRYDVVLLDTAPFLTTNDASELIAEVDQLVLVVRAGKTRRHAVARTAEVLQRFDAPILGVVLNDCDESPVGEYYYNYYVDGSRRRRGSGSDEAVGSNGRGNGSDPGRAPATASRTR